MQKAAAANDWDLSNPDDALLGSHLFRRSALEFETYSTTNSNKENISSPSSNTQSRRILKHRQIIPNQTQ